MTEEERLFMFTRYYRCDTDYDIISTKFVQKFIINFLVPSRLTVLNLHNRFQATDP